MSSNRLRYDECSYRQALFQSVSPIDYALDPIKYEHQNKCRNELGLVGGTNVSHVAANLVDLENDLRGQTRPVSKCPSFDYRPPNGNILESKELYKPVQHPALDLRAQHLPVCQMVDYRPAVPQTPPMQNNACAGIMGRPL